VTTDPRPEPGEGPPAASEQVLALQRDANEKLLLASLRAHEAVEDARDAAARAETEATSLRALELELRATGELRERLIGIIGHDLRNPLNTIVMAAGLLVADGDLAENNQRLAGIIGTSAHRMSRMIAQLVAFTRARMGAFVLAPAPVDLGEVCRTIAEEARLTTARSVDLRVEGVVTGTWDFDLLAETVSNVVGNAIDHAEPNTAITIACRVEGEDAVAEITNLGAAIPPEILPRIFDAFRRADADGVPRVGHLGLGLYIACEIVRAHHGGITARSADGSTTFTLRLPRHVLTAVVEPLPA
jgi:signal transduction histidine kinase